MNSKLVRFESVSAHQVPGLRMLLAEINLQEAWRIGTGRGVVGQSRPFDEEWR